MWPVEKILGLLDDVRPVGNGYSAWCPAHGVNGSRLEISIGEDGKPVLWCSKCGEEKVKEAIRSFVKVPGVVNGNGHRHYRRGRSARQIMEAEYAEIPYVVRGLLPTGLVLLAGAPKVGKSFLILQVALAVAGAWEWVLDRAIPQPGPVLYLSLEDTDRRLQYRMKSQLQGQAVPDWLTFETEWTPLAKGGADEIDQWLTDTPGSRLIVIDTLPKIRCDGGGEASYHGDYAASAQLKKVADKHNVAIVCLLHLSKAARKDPFSAINGTQGLLGAADAAWILKSDRGDQHGYLLATGRDISDQALAMVWSPETCLWSAKPRKLYE